MKITQLEFILTHSLRQNAPSQVELLSIFFFKRVEIKIWFAKNSLIGNFLANPTYTFLYRHHRRLSLLQFEAYNAIVKNIFNYILGKYIWMRSGNSIYCLIMYSLHDMLKFKRVIHFNLLHVEYWMVFFGPVNESFIQSLPLFTGVTILYRWKTYFNFIFINIE